MGCRQSAIIGAVQNALRLALTLTTVLCSPGRAESVEGISVISASSAACIDATTLRASVARRLGYDPFSSEQAPRAVIELRSLRGELTAQVTLLSAAGAVLGERDLTAATCSELGDRLALALGIALDAEADAQPRVRLAPPELIREGRSAASPSPALWLGVGVAGALEATPTFAIATSLGLEVRGELVAVALEAHFVFPVALATAEGGSYGEQLYLAAVVPCLRWHALGACGVLDAGVAVARGIDFTAARTTVTPYLAVGARAEADWSVSRRWALRGQVGLLAPLVKPSIELSTTVLWGPPSVNVELGAAILMLVD